MQRKEAARTGRGAAPRAPNYPVYTPPSRPSVPDTYDSYEAEKKKTFAKYVHRYTRREIVMMDLLVSNIVVIV